MLYTLLRAAGGSAAMNIDGSVTPVDFEWTPPMESNASVSLLRLYIQDVSITRSDRYGNQILSPGQGTLLSIQRASGTVEDLLDGNELLNNITMNIIDQMYAASEWSGSSDASATMRWPFRHDGDPLSLAPGDIIRATVRGDLTGLVRHHAVISGSLIRH